MRTETSKPFWGGAGTVWRRQRILWAIFVVNFLLAFLSIRGLASRTGAVLDHSLAASRLVHGFDIAAFAELSAQPGISPLTYSATGMGYSLVFFFFLLFVTGGILEAYRRNAKMTTGEFFEASGNFFWRFVRLLIFLLLFLIPIAILAAAGLRIANHIASVAVSPMASIWFRVGGGIVILFLLMVLRLWFDMAEIHSVAQNERKMRRSIAASARLTFRHFGSLFWLYWRISVIAWMGFAFGLWLWMDVLKPEAMVRAFLLGQLMILFWLGTRLWQRASETRWYAGHAPAPVPAPVPVPVYTAAHIETQTLAEDI